MAENQRAQSASEADLVVRKALPEDREALHDLLFASWMTTWAPACPDEAVAAFCEGDPVSAYLNECLEQIDVGVADGRIVAAMHLDEEHLAALHVAPELKSRGFGSAMMDKAEARGARRLEVRAFNERAIRFYENRGWRRERSYVATEMGAPMETHEYAKAGRRG